MAKRLDRRHVDLVMGRNNIKNGLRVGCGCCSRGFPYIYGLSNQIALLVFFDTWIYKFISIVSTLKINTFN
jgi:hypothetical protein